MFEHRNPLYPRERAAMNSPRYRAAPRERGFGRTCPAQFRSPPSSHLHLRWRAAQVQVSAGGHTNSIVSFWVAERRVSALCDRDSSLRSE